MAGGIFFESDASHNAVVGLLVLEATLLLPIAQVLLLKLQKQGATTILPSCVCYFAHLGPHLYSQSGCVRITMLGQLPG